MEAIYVDMHIHTSENANSINENYDVKKLKESIENYSGCSNFLISFTDHNTINKKAYLDAKSQNINLILGSEIHIKYRDEEKSYHCHIYFNSPIEEEVIDRLNKVLDNLYPNKLPQRDDNSIPDIQKIINEFDEYDFILLPHGAQRHGAFNYSIREGELLDTAINRSIYYNQFDGFSARSNNGLESTHAYFERLGISDFVNLLTGSDNYNPHIYPKTKSDDASEYIPTWMFAEPTFDGLRLSLSEKSRLIAQKEQPKDSEEHIRHVYLKGDNIDIDVNLTEGLNVVIGSSSSGKTLFVDSIYRAINQDFKDSKYVSQYGVDKIEIENPSAMHPYYISQNFISENINEKNEKSIDKIDILKNIFPSDNAINSRITQSLNELNEIINTMFQHVSEIEKLIQNLNAIPHFGKLIISGDVKHNLFSRLLPSTSDRDSVKYTKETFDSDCDTLNRMKSFLKLNPITVDLDKDIDAIIEQLEHAKEFYDKFCKIEDIIKDNKRDYDIELREIQGKKQEAMQNKERLIEYVSGYTKSTQLFKSYKNKLVHANYSFESSIIKSMGHTLSIRNNFKFNEQTLLDCLNHYLKGSFKSVKDVIPVNMFSKEFKDRPRVESYDDLGRKINSDLQDGNTKTYEITTKNGKDFKELSPGWKTAILLDLILGYDGDNAPIIIDQPEDNLAVKYINSELVNAIKEVKRRKQIILVSHNATIPMMADAQNIIVCENDGKKIKIRSSSLEGSLNDKKILDYIADQTDGGKSSIKKRVKKYNLKKFN